MTTQQRLIKFQYEQSLTFATDRAAWAEGFEISTRLFAEVFSSGWYREKFGSDAKRFMVFLAIVMHSRPLTGADLQLLISLGMATQEDEGRLYARITDTGLAAELGFHRQTVVACTEKLASAEDGYLIRILDLPAGKEFRDSRGQYAGSKLYLVSGDLENRLQKQIHRVEKFDTVRDEFSTTPVEKFTTNIKKIKEDEEEKSPDPSQASPLAQTALNLFAHQHGGVYTPSPREIRAANALVNDGFTEDEIASGIAFAFAQAAKPVQRFTYCTRIIRQRRNLAVPDPESQPISPGPGLSQVTGDTLQSSASGSEKASAPVVIDADLVAAVDLLKDAGHEITAVTLARLRRMAARVDAPARVSGSSGVAWLLDALHTGAGVARNDRLLPYADRVLADWSTNGRAAQKSHTRGGSRSNGAPARQGTMLSQLQKYLNPTEVSNGGENGF